MADNQAVAAAMLAAIQALQTTVGQLVQAQQAAAQQQPPVQPAQAAVAPATFATVPGMASANILDYTKSEDLKFYYKAIAPLTTKFNLTSDELRAFLERINDRARIHNWISSVLTIPDANGVDRNLVVNYGLVTMDDCVRHATQQLAVGQDTRNAQDSEMLYQFLTDSLTDEAKIKVGTNPSLYTVGQRMSGACYLKVIIGKSMIDTDATINTLRIQISNLSQKIVELKYNIKEFNSYVAVIRNSLLVRGEDVPELVINLFKAYLAVSDDEFVRYMRIKKDASDDGKRPSVDELLAVAENKYASMVEEGSWKMRSAKDDKIIALQSEIQRRDALKANSEQNKSKADKFAWKKIPPKNGETTKVVGPNTYYWCPKHQMWTVHRPEDCRLEENGSHGKKTEKKAGKPKTTRKLSLAKAYRAMIEDPQYVNDMDDEEYVEDSDSDQE